MDADGSDHWRTCAAKDQKPEDESGWPRVYQARQFIDRLAATKSMNAAIRKLGVPTSMAEERAAQPWVVMSLVFDPPTDDPEVRRMLVAHALGSQAALYGPPTGPRPAPAREVPSDVIDVSAMEEAPPEPAEPELPPIDEPPLSCGLPIDVAWGEAHCPTNDENRYKHLQALALWCKRAEDKLGTDRAGAVFSKLGGGFTPATAPIAEVAAMAAAIKAELPGGGK